MTSRLDRIRETWDLWGKRFDFSKRDAWDAMLETDVSPLVIPYLCEEIPTQFEEIAKVDKITFTAERCYYVNDGELYEWHNIICEGHIIDMEWIS